MITIRTGIIKSNSFTVFDQGGVGKLTRSDIKLSICDEHGNKPKSIQFTDLVVLSYVSCSPYRIPIVRLVTVQYTVLNQK